MKTSAPLLLIAAALPGCTVVPAGRPVVYGPPPVVAVAPPVVAVAPPVVAVAAPVAVYPAVPPVVLVPPRPYYGAYGYAGRRHGYWR